MSTNHHGVIVGLTGGIATGKSTVTDFFRNLGVVVIDADRLARDIVARGSDALQEIVETFGADVLHPDGTLNRTSLGERIFRDQDARKALESITHPRIAQEMFRRAQAAFDEGHRWVIYDAALLVETGTHRFLDALIVVDCRPETQLARLLARDDFDEEEARRRIASQMPLSEKRSVADFVIDNDATPEETCAQVEKLKEIIDQNVKNHGTAKPQGDKNHG